MTDLLNLPVGARVLWVRPDPKHGCYGVPCGPNGQLCVLSGRRGGVRSDGKISYGADIDGLGHWFLLSSMIILEEGPW